MGALRRLNAAGDDGRQEKDFGPTGSETADRISKKGKFPVLMPNSCGN
jgi:hypothetical protein